MQIICAIQLEHLYSVKFWGEVKLKRQDKIATNHDYTDIVAISFVSNHQMSTITVEHGLSKGAFSPKAT